MIATAGTTNTGSIDPLRDIASICGRYDMWMHVDGAFGASVLISDRYRKLLRGIELSDSLSWDAHKWMMQTYGCSVALVRDISSLTNSFSAHPEYLKDAAGGEDSVEFWDLGPELTRPARSLKLWTSLAGHGNRSVSKRHRSRVRHGGTGSKDGGLSFGLSDSFICQPWDSKFQVLPRRDGRLAGR